MTVTRILSVLWSDVQWIRALVPEVRFTFRCIEWIKQFSGRVWRRERETLGRGRNEQTGMSGPFKDESRGWLYVMVACGSPKFVSLIFTPEFSFQINDKRNHRYYD